MNNTKGKNFLTIVFIVTILVGIIGYSIKKQNRWVKYGNMPILGDKTTGTLFDANVIVLKNGKYRMYVSTRKNGSISMSESNNGIDWSELKVVLSNNGETEWDGTINRCSVIYKDGIYKMYYTGQDSNKSKIGIAQSNDGLNFKKVQDVPIIVPETRYEQENVMNPCVFYDTDEKVYKMWYSAGQKHEPDVLCYATSEDGIKWNKHESNPIMIPSKDKGDLDCFKLGACDVHKLEDNSYIMFYIGYTDINTARIFYATSNDGVQWKKHSKNPIVVPSKNGFDSEATYKPSAIYDFNKNEWILWYNGRTGDQEYIGFVTCKDYFFNKKYREKRVKNE